MQLLRSLVFLLVLAALTEASVVTTISKLIFGRSLESLEEKVDFQGSETEFRGDVKAGETVTITELITKMTPTFLKKITEPLEKNFKNNPLNFRVKNFTVSRSPASFSIGTDETSSYTLIKNFLTITNVTAYIKVTVDLSRGAETASRFQINQFSLDGKWIIAKKCFTFHVDLMIYDGEYVISGGPCDGVLRVGEFIQSLGTTLFPATSTSTSLKTLHLDRFDIENAGFYGKYVRGTGLGFSLYGSPTFHLPGTTVTAHGNLIVHRYSVTAEETETEEGAETEEGTKNRWVVTVILGVDSFKLADVVKRIGNIDISRVPGLGSLRVPNASLVISTNNVDPNLVENKIDDFTLSMGPIEKGVALVTDLPLSTGNLRSFLRFGNGNVKFSIDDTASVLKLKTAVDLFTNGYTEAEIRKRLPGPIANVINAILNVRVSKFDYVNEPRSVSMELRLDGNYVLVSNYVEVSDVVANIDIALSTPRKTTFSATSNWYVAGTNFTLNIESPPSGTGFVLTATAPEIRIGQLITKFSARFLPDAITSIIQKVNLTGFVISEPSISLTLSSELSSLDLSGKFVFGPWGGATVSASIMRQQGELNFLFGVDFSDFKLSELIKSLTGLSIGALSLLDQSLKCGIVFSRNVVNAPALKGAALSQINDVKPGLTIIAFLNIPESCNSSFCRLIHKYLGNPSLFISVNIQSLSQFVLKAGLSNLQIAPGFVLSEVSLEFAIGTENYIGINAAVRIDAINSTFSVAIRVGQAGLEILLDMVGHWIKPFGIPFLQVRGLHAAIAFHDPFGIGGVELGGSVTFGLPPVPPNAIDVDIYVGIDTRDPSKNFFYFHINKLTMNALLRAFGINVNLPRVLGDSGFPHGATVSYAVSAHTLPQLMIPEGFRMNGTLDIFGYQIAVDIAISTTNIHIDIVLDPLNLAGGLIVISRTSSDRQHGPKFYIDAKLGLPPAIKVNISGYCSLLKGAVTGEVIVQFNDKFTYFFIEGRIFVLFFNLEIYANYGSLKSAGFRAKGEVDASDLIKLQGEIIAAIRSFTAGIQNQIRDAKQKVTNANRHVDDTYQKAKSKEASFHAAVANLERKKDDLKRKQDDINRRFRPEHCHGNIFKKAGCKIRNAARWTARKAATLGLKTAQGALSAAQGIVNVARHGYDETIKVVNLAKVGLTVANAALEGVRRTAGFAGQVAESFIDAAANNNIFRLWYVKFDLDLGVLQGGHITGAVSLTILGKHLEGQFALTIRSFREIAESIWNRIKSAFHGRRSVVQDVVHIDPIAVAELARKRREAKTMRRRAATTDAETLRLRRLHNAIVHQTFQGMRTHFPPLPHSQG